MLMLKPEMEDSQTHPEIMQFTKTVKYPWQESVGGWPNTLDLQHKLEASQQLI